MTEAFKDVLGIAPRSANTQDIREHGAVKRWNRTLKEMPNKIFRKTEMIGILTRISYVCLSGKCHIAQQASYHAQLVYGRLPNGPLNRLKEVLTGGQRNSHR
ncbi:hypothetical protein TNIN_206861 [Trichonephila inaurata madagascariensis]|uniref:Uncharacterized protein n=1 Tax=Trichonephila inaurata madagascariensis TaxID=2747483 RepID=A0A8X6IUX0_9ARAC|nr:hypothetical protein TNIN_206861 [Trichonephila inaurata madagascariensis]